MRIKEAAIQLNVSQKTIRYYEERGMITPKTEVKCGRKFRDYDNDTMKILHTIVTLRKCQFTIEDIQTILTHPDHIQEICNRYRKQLIRQIGIETGICKLLEQLNYEEISGTDTLTDAINQKRREMLKNELYQDIDFKRFDEPFTDHDLFLAKKKHKLENDRMVATSYLFANPRVKTITSGGSLNRP